jgi:hypothetical protein
MSHLTTIKTQYNDVDTLREAVETFGLELTQGGNCRYFSGKPAVDWLVTLPGNYDVGFKQEADGSLSVMCDSELFKPTIYNGQKSVAYEKWGDKFERLTGEYNAIRITNIYRRKGHSVSRETRQDGSIKVVAMRG